MKNWILKRWSLGVILAVTPLVGGCLQQQSGLAGETAVSVTPGEPQQEIDDQQPPDEVAAANTEKPDDSGISDAPTKVISAERPLPPNIRPTETLSTLIRLIQSNMDESILLSYVTNSSGAFGLGPDEIIYLTDIGVPGTVISAMLQHDHLLVDSAAQADRRAVAAASEPPPSLPSLPEQIESPQDYVSDTALAPSEAVPFEGNFYDALAPYGTWVDVEGSGRCWQPSVVTINPGWQPYCDRGHWAYTDCGWYWASDYSWGWAPFHYGRWFRHSHLGWCWSPDNVWGPSWVSWRYSNNYCGWAPLPPVARFRPGLGFSYHGHSVGFDFNFGIRPSCYTFVPTKNFCDSRLSRHALPHDHVTRIFNSTVAVNKIVGDHNRISNYGIPAERIAAATHTHIPQVAVQDASRNSVGAIRTPRSGRGTLVVRNSSPLQLPQSPSASRESGAGQINDAPSPIVPGRGVATDRSRPALLTPRTPVNQVAHSEIPVKTQIATRDTSTIQKPSESTDRVRTWNGSVSGRVARRDSGAPLIIHGSPSSVSGRKAPEKVAAAANPSEQAAASRPHSQTHSSFASPRSVEGRPRYEQPEAGSLPAPVRLEAQTPFRPSPPAPIPQATAAYGAGYVHRPHIETSRYETVPSRASQAASYHHDTAPMRQSQVSSAQPAPSAHLPSAPSAASSHNNAFSSEKRGR